MVIGGIFAVNIWDFKALGVSVLGIVPSGLPLPVVPKVRVEDLRELLPLALACFLLGAVETSAIARMFATKHGYRIDNNQEFLALAAANLAAGLSHGYPISGGMSQSLVNESAGARSPLSSLIASLILLLVAVFFTGLLQDLPNPVLAAIVIVAGLGLIKVKELTHLWRCHRGEFFVAAAALCGVLWAGLLKGVLIGAIISFILLLRRASCPHIAILGRIPGTRMFSDRGRHPNNEPIPGVFAFRVEAAIVYFNSEHIFNTVIERLSAEPTQPKMVVADLSTSPNIDLAGARMLLQFHRELAKRGIVFHVVDAHASARDMLRIEGLESAIGKIDRRSNLADLLDNVE